MRHVMGVQDEPLLKVRHEGSQFKVGTIKSPSTLPKAEDKDDMGLI